MVFPNAHLRIFSGLISVCCHKGETSRKGGRSLHHYYRTTSLAIIYYAVDWTNKLHDIVNYAFSKQRILTCCYSDSSLARSKVFYLKLFWRSAPIFLLSLLQNGQKGHMIKDHPLHPRNLNYISSITLSTSFISTYTFNNYYIYHLFF